MTTTVPIERITNKIYLVRDQKVMLDRDLAELYGVETKILKRAVRRNIDRFSNTDKIGLKYAPLIFTEQGVAMLSSILRSKGAVQANIQIMRAFIKLRQMLSTHGDLKKKIEAMEKNMTSSFKSSSRP